jgi:hypothetical protein
MVKIITQKTKKKAKERSKDTQFARTKEGGERSPFMVGTYFTHNTSNVIYMQIVKFNSYRESRTSISCQCNFPFNNRSQSMLKNIINTMPKILIVKGQRQMTSQSSIVQKTSAFLDERCILHMGALCISMIIEIK